MILRLEMQMMQPAPSLKSSSALFSQSEHFSLEENKEKSLNDCLPDVGRVAFRAGKSSGFPPCTGVSSDVLLLPDISALSSVRELANMTSIFLVSPSENAVGSRHIHLLKALLLACSWIVIHHGQVGH